MKNETSTAPEVKKADWSESELALIQQTVAQNATPEELQLFLYTAKARGLNPLLKQIHFIKRRQKRGDRWVETGTVQTGIDGFRLIANRTGKLRGIERGTKRDEAGHLYAWARVWREDWEHPAYEEVSLAEYGSDTALWLRMPEQMLKKCAEVAALRMAFPEDLSGLYSHEEMDQAGNDTLLTPPVNTTPHSSEPPSEEPSEASQAKSYLNRIAQIQKDLKLSKDEIQAITGLKTLKGADLATLEKALEDLQEQATASDA